MKHEFVGKINEPDVPAVAQWISECHSRLQSALDGDDGWQGVSGFILSMYENGQIAEDDLFMPVPA